MTNSRQDLPQLLQDENGRSCASLTPVSREQQCFCSETHTLLSRRLRGAGLVTIWSLRLSVQRNNSQLATTHMAQAQTSEPSRIFLEILTGRIAASCLTPSTGLGKGGCKTKSQLRPWVSHQQSHEAGFPGSIRSLAGEAPAGREPFSAYFLPREIGVFSRLGVEGCVSDGDLFCWGGTQALTFF